MASGGLTSGYWLSVLQKVREGSGRGSGVEMGILDWGSMNRESKSSMNSETKSSITNESKSSMSRESGSWGVACPVRMGIWT